MRPSPFRPSVSALITFPREDRLLFIPLASSKHVPVAPVLVTFSDPAKSACVFHRSCAVLARGNTQEAQGIAAEVFREGLMVKCYRIKSEKQLPVNT